MYSPSPGSPIAKSFGCLCDEITNSHGCGDNGVYSVKEMCPMHGIGVWARIQEPERSLPQHAPQEVRYQTNTDYGSLSSQLFLENIEIKCVINPSSLVLQEKAIEAFNEVMRKSKPSEDL